MVSCSRCIPLSTEAGGKPPPDQRAQHQGVTSEVTPLRRDAGTEELPEPRSWRWQHPACLPSSRAQPGLLGEEQKPFAPHPTVTHGVPALPEVPQLF